MMAGFYVKEDGRVNPVDVTMALAKGARMRGVRDHRGHARHGRTAGARPRDRRAHAHPATSRPTYVVNCAGMWARQFGALAGVNIQLRRPSTTT